MTTTMATPLAVPTITPDDDNLTAALAYAEAGWYLVPVRRGTKHPGSILGKAWQSQSSRDPAQIAAWFAGTDHGIALHAGRSGAVIVDMDHPEKTPDDVLEALRCSGAPFQSTRAEEPGRGHHVFTQPPGRTLGNSVGPFQGCGFEVRGINGVIIAAPSQHAEPGGRYEWEFTGPVPVLPARIADDLPDATDAADTATDEQVAAFLETHTDATRPAVLHGWRKALQNRFETGSRHDGALSVTAGAMKEARAGFFPARDAVDMLRPMFITAATRPPTGGEKQRTERSAIAEFDSILAWAVAQANAANLDEVLARTAEKMPPTSIEEVDDFTDIYHAGQLGMADKLAEMFAGKLLHVFGLGWHHWNGKRWVPDNSGAARRAVHTLFKRERTRIRNSADSDEEKEKRRKAIARYENASAISGILTEAAALQVFSINVADIDSDPYLLNCANGTLDLRTMELRDHDPADRITKITRAAYDPHATGPAWSTSLAMALPDEDVRNYLRRVIGVALLGMVIEHNLVILTGEGGNGKGTFYKAVIFALGDYGDMADPQLFMARKGETSQGEMALRGQRIVVVTESGRDVALDEARMKRLTGGDIISGRYLYQKQISFNPSHLPLFVTNHLPKVSGDDEAVWRRLRVVPFDVAIPQPWDKHIDEKLQAEADAILTWAIQGWIDYRDRSEELDEPQAVLVRTQKYRADSNDVGRFIEEGCLTGSPVTKSTTSQLHDAYTRWAKKEGGDELTLKAFGQALDRAGFPVTDRTTQGRWREGIVPIRQEDSNDA